jgi:hypothetical protein
MTRMGRRSRNFDSSEVSNSARIKNVVFEVVSLEPITFTRVLLGSELMTPSMLTDDSRKSVI